MCFHTYTSHCYNLNQKQNTKTTLKGCVTNFVARFILDIQFLAGLSTATAAVCILLWSALLFIYFIMKVNK